MNNKTMQCKIRKKSAGYEGKITVNGLRPTALSRSSDGSTIYTTSGAVIQSARALANRWGMELEIDDSSSKSAKRSKSKSSNASLASTGAYLHDDDGSF